MDEDDTEQFWSASYSEYTFMTMTPIVSICN
jgi:hypothetical protein